jgi:hypothetical protein
MKYYILSGWLLVFILIGRIIDANLNFNFESIYFLLVILQLNINYYLQGNYGQSNIENYHRSRSIVGISSLRTKMGH